MDLLRLQKTLAPALRPFGDIYASLMARRERSWLERPGRRWRPPAPTVSVGNISMGGSGKTPLCQWILGRALDAGARPVLLTRGYKARPPQYPYVVEPTSPAAHAGDEPLLIKRTRPLAQVVVDPRRVRSGPYALARFSPDLFVLDDGFQHLAVERDEDLVLLTPRDLDADWNSVFPAGPWREGSSALKRATAFLVKAPLVVFDFLRHTIRERLGHLDRPVFPFAIRPLGLKPAGGGETIPDLDGAPYLLVAGVANPLTVTATAAEFLGYPPLRTLPYPDHHAYDENDVRDILALAVSLGCKRIVVTPKDAVKLESLAPDFLSFDLDIEFGRGLFTEQSFPDYWEDALRRMRASHSG